MGTVLKTIVKIISLTIFLVAASCKPSINFNSTYLVRVEAYDTKAENVALAASIFSYSPEYVMGNIKSYNPERMSNGIKLGYHIPTDEDTNPTYRYTLNLKNADVRKNADKLRADFDSFIPQLIQTHVSKEALFEEQTKPAGDWLALLLDGELETAYSQSGSAIKDGVTLEQFSETIANLKANFGELQSSRFLRGQFYEDFQGQAELVNIVFEQDFSDNSTWTNAVMMGQEDGTWVPQGFYWQP